MTVEVIKPAQTSSRLTVEPMRLEWRSNLPIFAAESFLKAVSDEYGWLGGFDGTGTARCVLPYTIIRKGFVRIVRFRVETIPLVDDLSGDEEKSFLNNCVAYLRALGGDVIIPPTTNSIFRTFPDGADAAPYGTYVVNLQEPEETLWKNIGRITRQNINTARRDGLRILTDAGHLDSAYLLIKETFARSRLPFMSAEALKRFMMGLGSNGRLFTAYHQGVLHSCVIFGFSDACAYAIYAGNLARQHQGANKLIYWEAYCAFKKLGCARFDYVGARIDPAKGSKQEAINLFKERMGAKLKRGYMWKYALRPLPSFVYNGAVRYLRGGDIVDRERHKFRLTNELVAERAAARA